MRRFFLAALTLGFVLSGCSSDPGTGGGPGTSGAPVCAEANDCGAGLVCVSEQCVLPQCTVDQECNAGLRCVEYRCRFLGSMDAAVDNDSGSIDQDASMTDDAAVTGPDQFTRDAAIQPDARSFEFDLGTLDAESSSDDAFGPDASVTNDAQPAPLCDVNFDCLESQRCVAGRCIARCNQPDAPPCEANLVCDGSNGLCVMPQACAPACEEGFSCDQVNGRCIANVDPPLPCGGCEPERLCDEALGVCLLPNCDEDRLGGNHTADRAANLAVGQIDALSLCTGADWYRIVVPPGVTRPRMGVRLTAEVINGDGNLEIMVFPNDFAAGQRPIVEATTNRNPERLLSNELDSAPYYIKNRRVVARRCAGRAHQLPPFVRDRAEWFLQWAHRLFGWIHLYRWSL